MGLTLFISGQSPFSDCVHGFDRTLTDMVLGSMMGDPPFFSQIQSHFGVDLAFLLNFWDSNEATSPSEDYLIPIETAETSIRTFLEAVRRSPSSIEQIAYDTIERRQMHDLYLTYFGGPRFEDDMREALRVIECVKQAGGRTLYFWT